MKAGDRVRDLEPGDRVRDEHGNVRTLREVTGSWFRGFRHLHYGAPHPDNFIQARGRDKLQQRAGIWFLLLLLFTGCAAEARGAAEMGAHEVPAPDSDLVNLLGAHILDAAANDAFDEDADTEDLPPAFEVDAGTPADASMAEVVPDAGQADAYVPEDAGADAEPQSNGCGGLGAFECACGADYCALDEVCAVIKPCGLDGCIDCPGDECLDHGQSFYPIGEQWTWQCANKTMLACAPPPGRFGGCQ